MYWLVHAKRHDNDFDVPLFLLAIVPTYETKKFMHKLYAYIFLYDSKCHGSFLNKLYGVIKNDCVRW
jgi:hypothetical protein